MSVSHWEVFDVMRCPHCDYLLDDEESPPHMIFCSECGGKLDELSPPDSFPSTNSDNANFLSVEINVNRFYMDGMQRRELS